MEITRIFFWQEKICQEVEMRRDGIVFRPRIRRRNTIVSESVVESVVEIPKRPVCFYNGSKLLFSALNGFSRLKRDTHHFEADPILWVD